MRLYALREQPGRAPHAATAPRHDNTSHRGIGRVHREDTMEFIDGASVDKPYAKCTGSSERWHIDRHAISGGGFGFAQKFLPDGLSLAPRLRLPHEAEARLMNEVQALTCANIFRSCEGFDPTRCAS